MSTVVKAVTDQAFATVRHGVETARVAAQAAEDTVKSVAEAGIESADKVYDATVDRAAQEVLEALARFQAVVDKAVEPLP